MMNEERMVDPDEADAILDELYGPVFGTPACRCAFPLVNGVTRRRICPACQALDRDAPYPDQGDDSNPDPDPAPGRCRNCGEAHSIQRCPEVLAALLAPLTGAEIAAAWHRNYRRFARRIMQKPASERIHAAFLYSQYMAGRLPRQRYSLTIENTLVAWHRAAAA